MRTASAGAQRRYHMPFHLRLTVRAEVGPDGGFDYIRLLDRPANSIVLLVESDDAPVEVDLRSTLDPDEAVLRTRPASDHRRAVTMHPVRRRMIL